jgi:hypothetical protein
MGRNQCSPFPCKHWFLLLFGWGGWKWCLQILSGDWDINLGKVCG